MKIVGKNKRRRQQEQQSGRPVLVTFHITRPSATASAHRRSHGCGHESQRRGSKQKVQGRSHHRNRRTELLEYSRQLRALARQTTPPSPHRPPRRHDTSKVPVLHESTSCQQKQIKQRCCGGGGGGWSWKRVILLIFPFNSSSHRKSNRPRWRHDDSRRESDMNNNPKERLAALLLGSGRLTVSRTSLDHSELSKKLKSIFRRPSR